jgi:thioredoxin-like negative regulator of GroEL
MTWASLVEGFKKDKGEGLKLVKLNFIGNQELAKTLNVPSTPAIVIFQGGKETKRFVEDHLNYEDVENYLESLN